MDGKIILIVDDEEPIRKLFTVAFTKAGYQIYTAESAEKALEILGTSHIQVMFLDLNLPVMNGVELCRTIKKNNPMTIIYAVTGYASLFELAACREAGFEDYFTKPVNIGLLYKAAENAFEKIDRWRKK